MRTKKVLLFIMVFVLLFSLVACKRDNGGDKTNNAPVISGAVDKTITKGGQFLPLEGITASDSEDGDLTSAIDVKLDRFNKNVVGVYPITYTVEDSDGNVTSVTINITVEASDKEGPMLTGVLDKEIVIGDTSFNLTDGVVASDTVDGIVTDRITVNGTVDPWKVGEYQIEYVVTDMSNNETKVTRKITVGLGQFEFGEAEAKELVKSEDKYQFSLAIPAFNTSISSYSLVKLEFKVNAGAACELVPTLDNGISQEKISLSAGDNTVVVYFRVSAAKADAVLALQDQGNNTLTFSDVKVSIGEANDTVAPEISIPQGNVVLPANISDEAALAKFVLIGVSATDNVDGIVTSKLAVDFTGIDLGNFIGDKQVKITCVDAAGNVGEALRNVTFAKAYDTHLIADPTFDTDYDHELWSLNGGAGDPELYVENGVLVHHNKAADASPGWDSASCPSIRLSSDFFSAENWYLLSFKAKSEKVSAAGTKNMTVRIGLDTTEQLGWIENFEGANNTPCNLTAEWQNYYVLFYVHALTSEGGLSTVKFELKNGTFFWSAEEMGNTTYFDDLQVYLITNENSAPTFTLDENLPTTFGKGQDKPDLTKYVTAYDREDAKEIAITAANITESIDMSKAGVYEVVYKVADSAGKEGTYTLKIKVLEEADTEAPVFEEAPNLVKEFDQFSAAPDITKFVGANDNIDGKIEITMDMITTDANINVAGSYEITYKVKDSSGNEATKVITIVVKDKEAPKFEGKNTIKTNQGVALTAEDIIATLKVNDNVDGQVTLTAESVKGLADVNFDTFGKYDVTVEAADAAGNKATFAMKVVVRYQDTEIETEVHNYLSDTFTPVNSTITTADGVMTIDPTNVGYWASNAEIKVYGLPVEKGKTYELRISAKADEARKIQIKLGNGLSADPWFDLYTLDEDSTDTLLLGTEYANYVIRFRVDIAVSNPVMEFMYGYVGHAGDKNNNKIYLNEFKLYSVEYEHIELASPTDYILGNGYYNSTDASRYNTFISGDTTSKKYVGTIFFTKETLPVGSVLEIAEGYQYRPEGWVNNEKQASRPGNVTDDQVIVTEEWWGNYIKRAFNISRTDGGTVDSEEAYKAAVAAFKIYVPKGTVIEVKEDPEPVVLKDVNLLDNPTITKNGHEYSTPLVLSKDQGAGEWRWVSLAVDGDFTGYTKLVATINGPEGESFLFKVNDQNSGQTFVTTTGAEQAVEFDLPADFVWDASKKTIFLFPNAGVAGKAQEFVITKLELQGEGKDPVNLLTGAIAKDTEANYRNILTITKPVSNTGVWDSFWLEVENDITSYKAVKYVIKGTAGEEILFKPNDEQANEFKLTLTGEVQEGIIDLSGKTLAAGNKAMILFANPNATGTGNPITIYELKFLVELPEPEPNPNPTPKAGVEAKDVVTTAVNQSSNYATWNDAKTIATLSNLKDSITGGQWARWDYASNEDKGYVKVTVVLHATPGLKVMAKLDALTTPSNNAYDGIKGNKQTLVAGEDGVLTYVWDLAYLKYSAEKAGLAFDVANLQKLVFFACDGSGNAEVMASATVELVSIKLE